MSEQTDEYGGDLPIKTETGHKIPALGCSHCPASFFSEDRHAAHIRNNHPDKAAPESWESSEGHIVHYVPNITRNHPHWYIMSDAQSGKYISNMVLNREGKVDAIETHPKLRRQGLASELWHAAQQHAETTPGVPTPQHGTSRTRAGDAWAKKVGGDVPPVPRNQLLSARQMQGMIDFKNQ
jgi:GNAT superfamily N-acetyltransferase